MNSLLSRRPPKLEQGDLRRGKLRGGGVGNGGGGTLRRPPSASSSGREDSIGNVGSKCNEVKRKCCSLGRVITAMIVLILLAFLIMHMRFMFGVPVTESSGSGLRAKQNDKSR
jgi:hypothetical protein